MSQKQYEDNEKSCPGCGALESLWISFESKGFISDDGDLYCCQACSEGRVCSCNPERIEALLKKQAI